jgi:phosphohistidine phosphatase SixA
LCRSEGFHNVGYSQNLDARLTERGWDQAHALGRHVYSNPATAGVQLVVVSPMVRALETAAGVFGIEPAQCEFDPPTCLMGAQDAQWKVRTAHAAVSLRPGVKFVAMETCRERLGPGQCDKRQALEDTQAQFPGVDFR